MSLKEKITQDYLAAFKNKNIVAKNLLSVIKGEIQTVEKNTTVQNLDDESILKIIGKLHKSTKETLLKTTTDELLEELGILESYLPKQLSTTEIKNVLPEVIKVVGASSVRDTGKIMAELQKRYPGQINGKEVASCINEYFN